MKKEFDHHDDLTYETTEVIEAWDLNFNLGHVATYVAKAGQNIENPLYNLKKAKWYLEREILKLERDSIDWNCDRDRSRDFGDRHNF